MNVGLGVGENVLKRPSPGLSHPIHGPPNIVVPERGGSGKKYVDPKVIGLYSDDATSRTSLADFDPQFICDVEVDDVHLLGAAQHERRLRELMNPDFGPGAGRNIPV